MHCHHYIFYFVGPSSFISTCIYFLQSPQKNRRSERSKLQASNSQIMVMMMRKPTLRLLRITTSLLFLLSIQETAARAASSIIYSAANPDEPSSNANLNQPFEPSFVLQDGDEISRKSVSREEKLVQQFLIDMKKVQSLPVTKLTTPCHLVCKDTSNTKTWTLEDWDRRKCDDIRFPF